VDMPVEIVITEDVPVVDVPVVHTEIPAGMGVVSVSGNFNEGAKADIDWNDIVSFQRSRVEMLSLDFYPHLDGNPILKGGGGDYFVIEVIDGEYDGRIFLHEGQYDVYVTAYDWNNASLFGWVKTITVLAGETTEVAVVLGLNETYGFQFSIADLSGEYDEYGYAKLTVNGQYFYCSYSRYYTNWDTGEYVVLFRACLPIDFDGSVDESILIVTDQDGNQFATELVFNIFDVDSLASEYGFMVIPYIFPQSLGYLDLDIQFQTY